MVDDAYEMWCSCAAQQASAPSVRPIAAHRAPSLAETYTPDTSEANGSSIALVLTAGQDRMLLLGDARAEDVLDEMTRRHPGTHQLMFSAVKIAHHGSHYNTSPELLALIDAPWLRSYSSKAGARFSVHVVTDEWIQLGDVSCGG